MHRSTRLCLLLLALTLPGLAPAALITLSDNLSQTTDGRMSIASDYFSSRAQGFSTTGSAFMLTDVALPLSRADDAVGDLLVSIFNNSGSGGTPGAKVADVATIAASLLGTTSALYNIPKLSITLTPSTNYFLVLTSGGQASGEVYWDYTNSTSGTGFPSARNMNYLGSFWFSNSMTTPQQMRILADDGVVPEPATLALLAIGLAGLGARRAARRRR